MIKKGDYKREFKQFLYQERAAGLFLKNILSSENTWKEDYGFQTLKEYLNKMNPHDYVSSAFDWDEVNESFDYWARLSDKWCNCINKLEHAKRNLHRTASN